MWLVEISNPLSIWIKYADCFSVLYSESWHLQSSKSQATFSKRKTVPLWSISGIFVILALYLKLFLFPIFRVCFHDTYTLSVLMDRSFMDPLHCGFGATYPSREFNKLDIFWLGLTVAIPRRSVFWGYSVISKPLPFFNIGKSDVENWKDFVYIVADSGQCFNTFFHVYRIAKECKRIFGVTYSQ